ncbi:MAG: tyrosine-type recombinase/integrase, partial [Streptosporangiaceae bacterium]
GEQMFREYAGQWMRDRILKARTAELYDGLMRNHLLGTFGAMSMRDVDEAAIRRWRKERLDAGRRAKRPFGPVTVAKAYRLLHAMFETACEEDHIIRRNPCRITHAGKEESGEREIVSLPVIFKIVDSVPARYRALVLLATFADMRWGELAGLRRENIDLAACEIRIAETLAQPDKGGLRPDSPKSRSGKRTVAFPAEIVAEITCHLERFAEAGDRGFVFVGPKGGKLRRSNFHRSVWTKARLAVGTPDLHFHDLRHTGGTLSAATGATLKELMARLGHSSVRAAMTYQHASRDRDQAIAKALGLFVREVREASERAREEFQPGDHGA